MQNFMLVSPNARFLWKIDLICLAIEFCHSFIQVKTWQDADKAKDYMSHVMRKPDYGQCENRHRSVAHDQRLCFRYKFQDCSFLLLLYRLVYVRPDRNPRRPVFSHCGSYDTLNRIHICTKSA